MRDSEVRTVVIDAGGRYGIHPTWRSFSGEMTYVMFEPDAAEAERLAAKYRKRSDTVRVVNKALGEEQGTATINVMKHHGLSSVFIPNPGSFWFGKNRAGEGEVEASYEVAMTSVDLYCEQHDLIVDFLKIDTEGSELKILKGSEKQFNKNVIGVRTEVHFDNSYLNAPNFSDIYNFMTDKGFFLLNLDYTGKGAACTPFFDGSHYGVLTGTDATWLRPYSWLFSDFGTATAKTVRLAKYAAFCMLNRGTDVALDVLIQGHQKHELNLDAIKESALYRTLDISVQHLFYTLNQHPAHDSENLKLTYAQLFGKPMKSMHEFYGSEEVNPN
jgi:FkbM family methyltransferase